MVFGPGGEEGQFADMSEPAGRRRRLLFHLQELKYVNKRRRGAREGGGGGDLQRLKTTEDEKIGFKNTRHELIPLVDPDGLHE